MIRIAIRASGAVHTPVFQQRIMRCAGSPKLAFLEDQHANGQSGKTQTHKDQSQNKKRKQRGDHVANLYLESPRCVLLTHMIKTNSFSFETWFQYAPKSATFIGPVSQ